MINFNSFYNSIQETPLSSFEDAFRDALQRRFEVRPHGDLPSWNTALQALPAIEPDQVHFDSDAVSIGSAAQLSSEEQALVTQYLEMLHPWRKGPWSLFGIDIDTEWRSNLKWDRIVPHLSPLKDRLVLDVGCGNGYYAWRMLEHDPRLVVGVDPSLKFMMQFSAFKHYLPQAPLEFLPLRDEELPARMQAFDTVLSMGVLYHRRSPFDHLEQLRHSLRIGGELVLETLVIEGGMNEVLVPRDRYAQMPNVWFIPSCDTLASWLERAGFSDVNLVDLSPTTTSEQRATDWMRFQSLADYLDPDDPTRTIEGYPAPLRATFVATKAGA